jgi:hypothetical protein
MENLTRPNPVGPFLQSLSRTAHLVSLRAYWRTHTDVQAHYPVSSLARIRGLRVHRGPRCSLPTPNRTCAFPAIGRW